MKKDRHVVKREGALEEFDERKVYASCYAACLASHLDKHKARKICDKVTKKVKTMVHKKEVVTSEEIFKETSKALYEENRDAAFMFRTHREIY